MLKKKLTFMLIPDSSGVAKQFSIRLAAIYGVVAAILVVTASSFFFSSQYFSDRVARNELDRLTSENSELSEKYEKLRWNIAELENRYQRLVEKEVTIRMAYDLPEISNEERMLGIGGPIPEAVSHLTSTEAVAYKTEAEVDRLLTLSQFELEKYSEVAESLGEIQDRLNHTPSIWPTKGWQSSKYGMRSDPFTGYKTFHPGLDIANHRGTAIVAPADGRVKSVSTQSGLGKILVIDHGYGFQTRYGHLSKIEVKRGQKVKRGDLIALMGASGRTTGPHLHYQVMRNGKTLNPIKYILNKM